MAVSKLPRWIELGAFGLAAIAGAVNAIGLLGFRHGAVSHLTGPSTLLGVSLARFDSNESGHLFLILVSFVVGAAVSGVVVGNEALRLGGRYSAALVAEAALLLLAMLALSRGSDAGHFLASAACGLQNGMVSTYSGAVLRTTHVTGTFTDLGTMLGALIRGHSIDRRRGLLNIILIAGFIAGGSVGALSYFRLGFEALLVPTVATLLLAAANLAYCRRARLVGSAK